MQQAFAFRAIVAPGGIGSVSKYAPKYPNHGVCVLRDAACLGGPQCDALVEYPVGSQMLYPGVSAWLQACPDVLSCCGGDDTGYTLWGESAGGAFDCNAAAWLRHWSHPDSPVPDGGAPFFNAAGVRGAAVAPRSAVGCRARDSPGAPVLVEAALAASARESSQRGGGDGGGGGRTSERGSTAGGGAAAECMKPCQQCKRGKKGPLFCRRKRGHTAPDWDWDGHGAQDPARRLDLPARRAPGDDLVLAVASSSVPVAAEGGGDGWSCSFCLETAAADQRWECPLGHRMCYHCWDRVTSLAARPLGAKGHDHEKERGIVMRCWGDGRGGTRCPHILSTAQLSEMVAPSTMATWLRGRNAKQALLRGVAEGEPCFVCAGCDRVVSIPRDHATLEATYQCDCGAQTCTDPSCLGEVTPLNSGVLGASLHSQCEAPAAAPLRNMGTAVEWLAANPLGASAPTSAHHIEATHFLQTHAMRALAASGACPKCDAPVARGELATRPRCSSCGMRWCRACGGEGECAVLGYCPEAVSALPAGWPRALARARLLAVRRVASARVFDVSARASAADQGPHADLFSPPGEGQEGAGQVLDDADVQRWLEPALRMAA